MHDLQEAYEMITNRFEEWKERQRLVGVRQGVEQGIEQGRLDGERALVLRLIQRRFGEVPPSVHKRLQSARQHQLETWADRVLDADSLDDIFG
ncbi:MAG: hypothetical protein ACJAZ5_002863 [Alloalcanivorax venustensis]|jgi:hypothetical protein|nr:hypothetical protein [Alcanivorax sp.]HAR59873.1 hypothetical protein [Alcanivorax sp.]HAV68864.1 hypothetical protein [Alcanivorax sp.]HBM21993.1 hypothetical protein [Alcanivorax sp.]HBS14805.1 hypothetical protein [Alcanivorax sp.]|tara:strand:- start:66235 stop:66513 length:279 start_codon:yes stop_codon:yes gene_type:complete